MQARLLQQGDEGTLKTQLLSMYGAEVVAKEEQLKETQAALEGVQVCVSAGGGTGVCVPHVCVRGRGGTACTGGGTGVWGVPLVDPPPPHPTHT